VQPSSIRLGFHLQVSLLASSNNTSCEKKSCEISVRRVKFCVCRVKFCNQRGSLGNFNSTSAVYDLWTLYSPSGVTAVDYQLRVSDDSWIVVIRVVGYDKDTIVLSKIT
jgi:hypothetical protein